MSIVAPYAGQNQQAMIPVPARIAYQQVREESCWVMMPYAQLYPPLPPPAPSVAYLPPPIRTSDLWSAMQIFPL